MLARATAVGLALVFAALTSQSALSEGAVAVGQPRDIAADGWSIGMSGNYKTEAEARKRALDECRTSKDAPPSTRNLCKIVRMFKNACAAAALDPKAGTPGAGWALAATRQEAQQGALEACRKTAGKERENFCEISAVQCDGVE